MTAGFLPLSSAFDEIRNPKTQNLQSTRSTLLVPYAPMLSVLLLTAH
jgi:hypothetical protein